MLVGKVGFEHHKGISYFPADLRSAVLTIDYLPILPSVRLSSVFALCQIIIERKESEKFLATFSRYNNSTKVSPKYGT